LRAAPHHRDVRFGAHYGLKSDIAPGPKCATNVHRSKQRRAFRPKRCGLPRALRLVVLIFYVGFGHWKLVERADDLFVKTELLALASVCEEIADNIEDHLTGGVRPCAAWPVVKAVMKEAAN
jgi:hypothetical protein